MGGTTAEIMKALRNRGRFHDVAELALDLQCSEHEVESGLKKLILEGKVEEGSWGTGHRVYGLTDEPKAEAKPE